MSSSLAAGGAASVALSEPVQAIRERLAEVLPGIMGYYYIFPILVLLAGAVLALILGVFRGKFSEPHLPSFGIGIVSAATAALVPLGFWPTTPTTIFGSGVLLDGMSKLGFVVIGLGTLFTIMMASLTNIGRLLLRSDMLALLLFASAGMMTMIAAGEFLSFFVSLEVMSLSLYILVGYQREDARSLEAAVKYFILGASASGLILLGFALLYLHTGSIRFADLGAERFSFAQTPLAVAGFLLVFSGLGFKLAMAPFHSWAPDVYQSAHSTLTGYMATLVKFSVGLVILRLLVSGVGQGSGVLVSFFWFVGALSIAIGSLFGLVHNSIKRMLAYSSIANAGYFCLAFAALAQNPGNAIATQSLVAYSVIYVVLSLGAFAVLAWFEEDNREDLLKEDLAGVGQRAPFASVCLTIFLLGLAGIPPLAGFFGKFMLIQAAVSANLVGLAVFLVLFSCLSLFYYLSVIVEIWLKPSTRHTIDVVQGGDFAFLPRIVGLIALVSLLLGIIGPRWAQELNFSIATEKAPARQNTALP